MYKIHTIHDNLLLAYEQGFFKKKFNETPELNWNSVGVFKEGGLSDNSVTLTKQQIQGKVVQVCQLLITVPINVLRET